MQTPRRQALLATLAGILAGVAVLGVVVVIRGVSAPREQAASSPAPSAPATSTPATGGDGLDVGRLTFSRRSVGDGTAVEVPDGWKPDQPSANHVRYVDPSDTWLIRVDARAQQRTVAQMLAARERGVRGAQDFRAVRRDSGKTDELVHRTLVYTYTNDSRVARMVMSRWISADGDVQTTVEITVGGRPQDEAGLQALLDRATESLELST
jgi:hypothetical protein